MRWGRIVRVLFVLVALVAVAGAGLLFLVRRSGLPQRRGEAAIPGLGAEAAVVFDRFGTPYVRSA